MSWLFGASLVFTYQADGCDILLKLACVLFARHLASAVNVSAIGERISVERMTCHGIPKGLQVDAGCSLLHNTHRVAGPNRRRLRACSARGCKAAAASVAAELSLV